VAQRASWVCTHVANRALPLSWKRRSPHVLAMAHIPLRMILSKPRQFFNVTPINRMGITVVDLGDIDDGSEAPRSSSLPPTSVKLFEDIIPRESRHSSLPRTTEDKVRRSTSRLTSEESDGNAEETRETGPHSDPGSESDNDSSRGTPDEDSKASLRSSHVSRA
jgi:hypothetical protein